MPLIRVPLRRLHERHAGAKSQPRVAKAENGDASVSIELLIRAMLATGATLQEIGKLIAEVG